MDVNGAELHSGVQIIYVDLRSANGDVIRMAQLCLEACLSQTDVTGCMFHPATKTCGTHSKGVADGDDDADFKCWVFSRCKPISAGNCYSYSMRVVLDFSTY